LSCNATLQKDHECCLHQVHVQRPMYGHRQIRRREKQ
jgi:hypothetical protein